MANELSWRSDATGSTIYCTIRAAARTMWNGTALEVLTVANWTNYDIALAETPASSYFYVGDWPAALTTAGWYWVDIYLQAGASPAISDTMLGTMAGWWDGTTYSPWAGDARQISGDDSAADALETMLDGTGGNVLSISQLYIYNAGSPAIIASSGGTQAILIDDINGGTIIGSLSGSVGSVTGHTPQTGDSFARLGAPAGASVSADIAAVKTDTGNLVTRIPAALFTGITSLAQWLGLIAGKQVGNSTARTELRATGAGSGTYLETTDSLEAQSEELAKVPRTGQTHTWTNTTTSVAATMEITEP